jgi:hypothetical protein
VADYGRRLAVEMRRLVGGRGVARALVRGLQYDRCPKCGTTDLDPHLLGLIHNLMDALAA